MSNNIVEDKSFDFAVRVVNLHKYLTAEKNEFVMSKQLLRSGTSIGANVAEAQRAQTKPDFHTKMSIAVKEANETQYWIKLLHRTEYITDREFKSLNDNINEILSLLIAICKNSK